jgi:hypothetical protein
MVAAPPLFGHRSELWRAHLWRRTTAGCGLGATGNKMMQKDSLEMRKTVTNLMVRWKTAMVDGAERIVQNSGGRQQKGTTKISQLRASLLDFSC